MSFLRLSTRVTWASSTQAYDPRLDRQVAIKVLGSHLLSDSSARERLRREAQARPTVDSPEHLSSSSLISFFQVV